LNERHCPAGIDIRSGIGQEATEKAFECGDGEFGGGNRRIGTSFELEMSVIDLDGKVSLHILLAGGCKEAYLRV
jgi:hypothetical protein